MFVLDGALRRRRTFLYEIIILFASDVPNSICVRHVGGGEIDASTDLNTAFSYLLCTQLIINLPVC